MKADRKGRVGRRRERRTFSDEFKAETVRLVQNRAAGVSLAQLSRELDVGVDQLRAWTRAAGEHEREGAAPSGESLTQEVQRLRRENAVLREEQAFAKKVAVYLANASR
jgi:transposase